MNMFKCFHFNFRYISINITHINNVVLNKPEECKHIGGEKV